MEFLWLFYWMRTAKLWMMDSRCAGVAIKHTGKMREHIKSAEASLYRHPDLALELQRANAVSTAR